MEKKAKKTGPLGIDRWTGNGHGIEMGKLTEQEKEKMRKLNEEINERIRRHVNGENGK